MRGRQPPLRYMHNEISCVRTRLHGSCYLHWLAYTGRLVQMRAHVPLNCITCTRYVCSAAAVARTATVGVGGSRHATCKDIRSGNSVPVLTHKGLRPLSHGVCGRRRAAAQRQYSSRAADGRNPSMGEPLRHPAVRPDFTHPSSAIAWLLTQRVVSGRATLSPHVRILDLLLGLKRSGNADGATLSTCCLNI